jgi:16S rRNA (guanine527-N7)-methyltransferase
LKLLKKYFPDLSKEQIHQFELLSSLFIAANEKVNMISRKDTENLEERHILHSLAIAKFIQFKPQTQIMDVGTGGGFPGLPLAILFPKCKFYLVDSIGKKINVVQEITAALNLMNVEAINARAESLSIQADFIVSRAVAPISELYRWSKKLITKDKYNDKPNGFILLKGGNLTEEKNDFKLYMPKGNRIHEIHLDAYFNESFFETKKIIYFPAY